MKVHSVVSAAVLGLLALFSSATIAAPGELDSSFGTAGKVVLPLGNAYDSVQGTTQFVGMGAAVAADGKIVIATETFNGQSREFTVFRFNANGSLDGSFGNLGKTVIDFTSGDDVPYGLTIQPDGKVLVVGRSFPGNYYSGLVSTMTQIARLTTSGALDASFGSGGKVSIPQSVGFKSSDAFVLADGRIVLGGFTSTGANFALARLTASGTLDTTLNGTGFVAIPVSGGVSYAFMLVQPDGKFVLGGSAGSQAALARVDFNGVVDNGFGGTGVVVTNVPGGMSCCLGGAVTSEGKIILTNTAITPSGRYLVLRLKADGMPDATFGAGGLVTTDLGGGYAFQAAVDRNGKILIAGNFGKTGTAPSFDTSDFAVLRYLSDGSVDTTFGTGGKVVIDVTGQRDDLVTVRLQPDEKILLFGRSWSGGASNQNNFGLTLVRVAAARTTTVPGLRDFNADDKGDVVWLHASSGAAAVWLMNGLGTLAQAVVYAGGPYRVSNTGDLNGDGKTDLIFKSPGGPTAAWLMNGTGVSSAAIVLADPTWIVTRVADFSGDGKDDLLWRNTSTGQTAIWIMNGLASTSSAVIYSDPNWVATNTADFNGDGKADLVWRNDSTGQTAIWLMDGTTPTAASVVIVDPNWFLTHTTDLNGDGKADMVWQSLSGATAAWLMDGTASTSSATLFVDVNWYLTNVGDFNGDGKGDLLWYHPPTGQTAMWLMNGVAALSSATMLTDRNWRVMYVADTNGDGKSDLLWGNLSAGTALWLMNGTAVTSSSLIFGDPTWWPYPPDGF